jgi:hypothetical protein
MMLEFNDLLNKFDIDPMEVNIARHRPEIPLRARFPWIASERPELFEYYQSTQSPNRERMLLKRRYLASFIGLENGSTIFVGLYRKCGIEPISKKQFHSDLRSQRLQRLGCSPYPESRRLVFDFKEIDEFKLYKGRLFIEWTPGTRSFIQVAGNRSYAITHITEESQLVEDLR